MIGATLSHYRITEKLRQGGMGVVYRAEDTNLSRQIAIKVLPDMFTSDPERLARFEREARLLASLNHPNIAAIHGLEQAEGKRFLVLELVEGETLAQRLLKGPLPVQEALEVCRQIAEGVEAAHEKGVIHRDLKPANVKITPEGKVKILDFGLAKAFQEETAAADLSQSPTLTAAMTRAGVILGTAAYMSPEQAKGKAVDKRTDIWAFACILYECLTGKRAFEGETISETIASILRNEPDWTVLPVGIQEPIRRLLSRCFIKEPSRRLRDIGDAIFEMSENVNNQLSARVFASMHEGDSKSAPILSLLKRYPLTAIVIGISFLVLLAVGVYGWLRFGGGTSQRPVAFSITPFGDDGIQLNYNSPLAIDRDGSMIAYRYGNLLRVRHLGEFDETTLQGAGGAGRPFFSPD